ncbi:MAG: exodeoxyribonuclease III [Pseudoclavibacter sp.]
MRIATWNVNSIRARIDRVVEWLDENDVDVLAMQEIKCKESQFPFGRFEELGYEVHMHGLNQWNGVALVSRIPAEDVERGFAGQPEFRDAVEARAIGATFDGVRVWSLYVPNGRELDDPHYAYKLAWLRQLHADAVGWLADDPDARIALVGDWNIAPRDTDVWDMKAFAGKTHVSQPERDAFAAFERAGFSDVVRPYAPGYTYWDYKQLRFIRDEGMRIDFVMGSPAFAAGVENAFVDRGPREGVQPSDHVPVVVDIDVPGAFDNDRPMAF